MATDKVIEGPVVIIGTGQAGFQTAASLRIEGFEGDIFMFGDEPGLPYQRPPLSKAFFKDGSADRLLFRNQDFFEKNNINIKDNCSVKSIDRHQKQVLLDDGAAISYEHLVLATGTRNRELPIAGSDLKNVLVLRTLADANHIRKTAKADQRVVMIGGGFIGLELASVLRDFGCEVAVIEAESRPMARAVSEQISTYFVDAHTKSGIKIHCSSMVSQILGDNEAEGVKLSDGTEIGADLVFICAGVVPNSEIASEAGLKTNNGILVDDLLLSNDPSISAIGDCASFVHKNSGVLVRLESVQNAADQAKCVAKRLTGNPQAYNAVPWFWSDQGGKKLQIAGLTGNADQLICHEDEENGKISVFAFENAQFVGVEAVNMATNYVISRKILETGKPVTLSDFEASDFDLREVLKKIG
ncbi:Ferredoxin reductase [hydrothermal vent metagenome]|uniref:Ferredoxin reductase n=1 Tax=hydrothermal vent metagenome TaxID=652676 RepID=A0A3B0U1C7_9ZZZZ